MLATNRIELFIIEILDNPLVSYDFDHGRPVFAVAHRSVLLSEREGLLAGLVLHIGH